MLVASSESANRIASCSSSATCPSLLVDGFPRRGARGTREESREPAEPARAGPHYGAYAIRVDDRENEPLDLIGVNQNRGVLSRRTQLILFVLVLGIAAALRGLTLSTSLGTLEADEAVWGLMARHILDGEPTPFFWAQNYGGTQEAILTAGLFKIAGSSIFTLRLVPVALHAVAVWLVWRLGRITIGERPAILAASLFAIAPAWLIYKSTRAHGFYGVTLVVSLATMLLVLRLRNRIDWTEAALLGFALGTGWWASPQVVLIAGPALVWLIVRNPSVIRTAPLILITACVGAAPWIVDNLQHDFHSLDLQSGAPPGSTYGDHLVGFFEHALPAALGLRVSGSQEWVIPSTLGWLVYASIIASFVWLLIKRPKPLELLLAIALPYPFIVAASEFSWYVAEPRYVYLLLPVIALLGAYGLSLLRPHLTAAATMGILALSVAGLLMMTESPDPLDFSAVVETIEAHDVDRAFSEYALAYPISFVAGENVIATSTGHVRYAPHDEAVRHHPHPAWVFRAGSSHEPAFAQALDDLGLAYERVEIEDFVVYFPESPVHPEAVPDARG